MSYWNAAASPFVKSPWTTTVPPSPPLRRALNQVRRIREEARLYSVTVFAGLLYTESDSKNIRMWKNCTEFFGFKCGNSLVKAIVIFQRENIHRSWNKTIKVWRIADFKCLESVSVAVNSVVVRFDRLVFTRSADGTVKVLSWDVNRKNRVTKYVLVKVLLRQESEVSALAASHAVGVVHCGPDSLFCAPYF